MDPAQLVGPEWFGALAPDSVASTDIGITIVLRFDDARRIQGILESAIYGQTPYT
jgi:hypothetical protein